MSIDPQNIKCSFPNREDMQNKISLLEKKIVELEENIKRLHYSQSDKSILMINSNIDETYKKIMKECSGNIWLLKNLISKQPIETRTLYITTYNRLCQNMGCWIGFSSKWQSLPTLPHGFQGIFVSDGAKVGKHCTIFQNVTIGSNTLKDSRNTGSPCIGDNVYIGAGATIVGNCKVGNNVRIGAGCSVAIDIPDNSVVVSQKPIIIHKENMDNRFYHYENGKYGYVQDGIFYPNEN